MLNLWGEEQLKINERCFKPLILYEANLHI